MSIKTVTLKREPLNKDFRLVANPITGEYKKVPDLAFFLDEQMRLISNPFKWLEAESYNLQAAEIKHVEDEFGDNAALRIILLFETFGQLGRLVSFCHQMDKLENLASEFDPWVKEHVQFPEVRNLASCSNEEFSRLHLEFTNKVDFLAREVPKLLGNLEAYYDALGKDRHYFVDSDKPSMRYSCDPAKIDIEEFNSIARKPNAQQILDARNANLVARTEFIKAYKNEAEIEGKEPKFGFVFKRLLNLSTEKLVRLTAQIDAETIDTLQVQHLKENPYIPGLEPEDNHPTLQQKSKTTIPRAEKSFVGRIEDSTLSISGASLA
jgi:hypothetical protein